MRKKLTYTKTDIKRTLAEAVFDPKDRDNPLTEIAQHGFPDYFAARAIETISDAQDLLPNKTMPSKEKKQQFRKLMLRAMTLIALTIITRVGAPSVSNGKDKKTRK